MIFSNKINKISSGSCLSLYATSNKEMTMFIKKKNLKKAIIKTGDFMRCFVTKSQLDCNYAKQMDNEFIILATDENITVERIQ